MTKLDELYKKFEEEDRVWIETMDDLAKKHKEVISSITDDMSTKVMLVYVDIAMHISDQMSKLDTEHKEFLLKWQRKIQREITIDFLKELKG